MAKDFREGSSWILGDTFKRASLILSLSPAPFGEPTRSDWREIAETSGRGQRRLVFVSGWPALRPLGIFSVS